MKRFSTSLIIREMQIKNYNEILPYSGQNGHNQKNLQTLLVECKLVQPLWKRVSRFLKKTENRAAI